MNPEQLSSALTSQEDAHSRHTAMAGETRLRKWVTGVGVIGTGFLAGFFFCFLAYQAVRGGLEPTNWLSKIAQTHYAALVGTPMSAVAAFCIVSLLKVTNGPIEFEAFGVKFKGASGPIILWALCFVVVVGAFYMLWPKTL